MGNNKYETRQNQLKEIANQVIETSAKQNLSIGDFNRMLDYARELAMGIKVTPLPRNYNKTK